ncbi:hypothetical protein Elgi_37850 [Paenibacillus elgii]|uniref:hypothetical protein n=1 Tax=Paenibacillus elgii TaxID=189691 RepID=UPI002D7A490F|nr:hypothetical protein Elgi_37850 [Paenibacillus elgii]
MYMMFIYVDGKAHNSMGIRGELEELYAVATQEAMKLFKVNPRSEVTTKITMYI